MGGISTGEQRIIAWSIGQQCIIVFIIALSANIYLQTVRTALQWAVTPKYYVSTLETQRVNIYNCCGRNNHIIRISPKKLVLMNLIQMDITLLL